MLSNELQVHLSVTATDPLPCEKMYYKDKDGKWRTIRGTSQLESLHKQLPRALPGTHMGVEGADTALTNFQFR
jgi:hypothetical protein